MIMDAARGKSRHSLLASLHKILRGSSISYVGFDEANSKPVSPACFPGLDVLLCLDAIAQHDHPVVAIQGIHQGHGQADATVEADGN